MKILGYSERGIINSLIFSIGEDKELMDAFVKLIGIHELFDPEQPDDYEILLEQSFSDFGDADLVIIVKYKNPDKKVVLFIEGKVKTSQGNWKLFSQFDKFNSKTKYKGYSSNLFYQLYFKKLMIDNWKDIKRGIVNKENIEIDSNFRKRKIGKNKIVRKAFDLIACDKAYYVGLIPSTKNEINGFKMEHKNTGIHFLSWEQAEEFCETKRLDKVLEMFDYNSGQIYSREN